MFTKRIWLGVVLQYVLPALIAGLGSVAVARVQHDSLRAVEAAEVEQLKANVHRLDVEQINKFVALNGRLDDIRDSQTELKTHVIWIRESLNRGRRYGN